VSNFIFRASLPALTVRQPWAALIGEGAKRYETRGWPPPKQLIGQRLAIHAGQARLPRDLCAAETTAIEAGLGLPTARWAELPLGALVCVAVLAGAYRIAPSLGHPRRPKITETLAGSIMMDAIELEAAEWRFGDFSSGRWAWSLRDIQLIDPPIRTTGQRRIWRWHRAE
jgi:activating signal cointegrator 1